MTRLFRLVTLAAMTGGTLLGSLVPAAAAAVSPTVVTFTFDDGTADQITAANTLNAAGMDATFYINSGRIGSSPAYMSRADLDALHAAGHEIAGHTTSHLNLTSLTLEGQRRQVCNDRALLMSWGFPVKSFAYPFGARTAETMDVVAECGYNNARIVGDLVSGSNCQGCDYAESIPPRNVFTIRSPDSIKSDTTLSRLQEYVTQAENHSGGWVPLVFHKVCSNACDPNSISPSNFSAFVSWLASRGPNTVVRTVDEVIGGQLNPAPPIVPTGPGTGELQNPGLEVDANADNQADCWQRAGFGTNGFTFSRSSDAHSGSFAERVDITSYTDGARRLVVRQDDGACSPAISAGARATISVWYKSNQSVRFSVFYRDATDTWRSWNTSPVFTASSSYRHISYTTPELPAGAIGISWGLNLQAVGFLVTDDYAMSVLVPDTIAPEIALVSPPSGATVTGRGVPLSAVAEDDTGVSRVEFLVGTTLLGSDSASPFGMTWDSTTVPDGSTTITARAVDTSGNTAVSEHPVTVANTGGNLDIVNGGLEDDANGDDQADCWQRATTTGTNAATFNRTADAHTGSFAERIDMTSWTSGSRRLVVRQDAGPCAIPVDPGEPYALSAWIKSTASSRITAFYRDAAGSWVTWSNSSLAGPAADWTKLSWTTPLVPAGATHLSFGVSLAAVGSLTVDDHEIAGVGPVDDTPPSVTLDAPLDGDTVQGATVALAATAADDGGVASVEFRVDGVSVGTDAEAPYAVTWDSSSVSDGPHSVTAVATDTSANRTTSAAHGITVDNVPEDTTPPTVEVTAPSDDATVAGDAVTVAAAAADDVAVDAVEFFVDAVSIGSDSTAPYAVTWDSKSVSNGATVMLTARATDTAGNGTTSSAVSVTVDNSVETVPPTVALNTPAANAVVAGVVTVSAAASDTSGVASVTFLADDVVVATDSTAPYSIAWDTRLRSDGPTALTARATDAVGNEATSAPRTVRVDNTAPLVAVSQPAGGATVKGPVNIVAAVSDASAIKVWFYINGLLINTDSTSPSYDTTWDSTAVPDGPASITLRATDAAGNEATSATITVNVLNADVTPPTVGMTAPANGATVGGSSVTVAATATDDRAVARVEFFNGSTLIGSDTSSPYSVSWNTTALARGSYVLTARAIDTSGNTKVSTDRPVNVENDPPTVALTAPADGSVIGGKSVPVSAAASDPAGIAKVDFLAGSTLIGTDTSAPYSVNWNTTKLSDGPRSLTARATDMSGYVTTSSPRTVTIRNDTTAPSVSISTPIAGAFVQGAVPFGASASDNGAVAQVEFFVDGVSVGTDSTSAYSVSWDTTSVPDGPVSLTVRATDASGNATTSSARSVTVRNAPASTAISNPGMESDGDGDGMPDCWARGGSGNSSVAYARVADAHSGSFAERMTVSSFKNGRRSFETAKDAGTCAIAVDPGRSYTVRAWYKSNAPVSFVVSYRNASGSWVSLPTSPTSGASSSWAEKAYTTGSLPAGASHLSFGINVTTNAVVTVDDHSIVAVP